MKSLVYQYPQLETGKLIKRYKRFFADIELNSGETVTAHCANTGPMTAVCEPGNQVLVSRSNNPNRKLAYTWEAIEILTPEPTWVGINTGLPNQIVKTVLEERLLPELGEYQAVQSEVVFGENKKSRVDFRLTGKNQPIYLEVKNTTWAKNGVALFPDTVTERGQKHLQELMWVISQGDQAVMLYFINREDCDRFAPGDSVDPVYGQLLRQAMKAGLLVLPCRFAVTPVGVSYLGLAELNFK